MEQHSDVFSSSGPYCGPAPLPETLWASWNLDPILLICMAVSGAWLYRRAVNGRQRLFALGTMGVLTIAFVSPLCALASALFTARVLHHTLIIAIAAPFVILVLPKNAKHFPRIPAQLSLLAFTALLWLWHAPQPYGWALSGNIAYWVMELTLLASALWLWSDILSSSRSPAVAISLLFGTVFQMSLLGALLTFAKRPLFQEHLTTTSAFGLSPLEDQQLAGLIMWVVAALPYLGTAIWKLLLVFQLAHPARKTLR